ncbi:MAG: N-acetylglucosamine-6-phosphate deacetylase, partial [Planctomycetes bacterium]|nr:N-acetylglucosamine-6-phosphate deacetylase [Planctomycetota bacterium]
KLAGRVLTPGGWREGALEVEGERIVAFREGPAPSRLLIPGFIDLHVHGGDGADVMDGPEGIARVAAFHLRHGTTSLCPTTITRPAEELKTVVADCAAIPDSPQAARLLGVHLEGPFLSDERRGAQPAFTRAPDLALAAELLALGPVSIVTLAPELPGALELIRQLRAAGVRVSLGHSACSYEEGAAGFAAGAGGVTHLFNAMSGMHHREPGLAAAALDPGLEGADERFHELILDTHHVTPALFRLAHRAARLCLVSDAIRAAGKGCGLSELGGQAIQVSGGRALLPDGTLAGSLLTLDQAFGHAIDAGLSVGEVSQLLSENPARALGREDVGRLAPGAFADLVELSEDSLELTRVWRSGVEVER